MIRIIGFLAIMIGTTGCGVSIVAEKQRELRECKDWIYVLSVIENEMAFQKSTLPEICLRISKHTTLDERKCAFFYKVYEKMNEKTGDSFGTVWRTEFQKHHLNKLCFLPIQEELTTLGEKLFFEDVSMQQNVIKEAVKKLEYYFQKKQKENEKDNKLTLCMGVMSGVLITVMLL